MNSHRTLAAALITVCTLAGASACSSAKRVPASAAGGTATSGPATPSTPGPVASSTGASPTPAGTTSLVPASPTPGSGGVSAIPTRSCLSGAVRVRYPGADNPLRAVCVHIGTQITVTLNAVPSYTWSPVVSSNPGVVRMLGNHAADGGTLVEVARAETPGTTTLTAADTFTPDPHGPPTRLWQLVVQVVP
ncbi:hypothetical protein ABIA33_002781 [Streptacidiphilus sp. MAP12-16]|uniref:hypothetical protein n=1 Tax=Streptacidiphilus sp. MAP12-16 TaxID=3156300 RepID=UPI003517E9E0